MLRAPRDERPISFDCGYMKRTYIGTMTDMIRRREPCDICALALEAAQFTSPLPIADSGFWSDSGTGDASEVEGIIVPQPDEMGLASGDSGASQACNSLEPTSPPEPDESEAETVTVQIGNEAVDLRVRISGLPISTQLGTPSLWYPMEHLLQGADLGPTCRQ